MVEQPGEFGGFGDAEGGGYGGGGKDSKLTYPFLVLEQVRRCAKAGSVEFKGGYDKQVPYANGAAFLQEYVPATHETFTESVLTLCDMLSGYFDKEALFALASFEENRKMKMSELEKKYGSQSSQFTIDYYFVRARLARVLFADLCKFLKRINFMEGLSIEEGVLDDR